MNARSVLGLLPGNWRRRTGSGTDAHLYRPLAQAEHCHRARARMWEARALPGHHSRTPVVGTLLRMPGRRGR